MKEGTQSIEHPSAVDRRLTEIRVLRAVVEVTQTQEYPDDADSLSLTHEGLIGALEVDERLAPEEVGIVRDLSVK